jgi:hypothetical protein
MNVLWPDVPSPVVPILEFNLHRLLKNLFRALRQAQDERSARPNPLTKSIDAEPLEACSVVFNRLLNV